MYSVIPQMQKIVLCETEKLQILEQIITDYEQKMEKIEDLARQKEEIDTKLKDMELKMQDFNIADLLKANAGAGNDGLTGEGGNNNLLLNLISNLEKKFNAKSKATDDRLYKIEESNFKLTKDTQTLKNAQDGNQRAISNLKQGSEDLITNMKNLEFKIIEAVPDITKKLESQIKTLQKEKEEKGDKVDTSKEEEKEMKNSISEDNKPEQKNDLENNEKIKEILKRLQEVEKGLKIFPLQIGVEQIKSDISALKSGISNCALSQDFKETKEKEDDMQKQINFLKDQFEDFTSNTADHEDLQNVKRKLELLNSKAHECETVQQELLTKMTQNVNMRTQFMGSDKYLEVQKFEDFKAQIIKEFSSVNDNFTHLRRLVDNILDSLKNKPSYRDIKSLEEEFTVKFEELKIASAKKFAEKIETSKNFKYLDQQIKHILNIYIKRENKTDNWLLAKKPLNANLCASCEAYIGDLKDNSNYQPWNKYPLRDPNDKVYRLGNGFSKMLQMIQVDENEKKNTGTVTQQNNNELNLNSKLMKMEKKDGNVNTAVSIGPIKTENNNNHKILPKIKGNNTVSNFNKNHINTMGNANRNLSGNNFSQENDGEQIDLKDGSDEEEEEEKPKITKIVKVNKE